MREAMKEVLEVIRELPDSTTATIVELCPNLTKSQVTNTIFHLKHHGHIIESGKVVKPRSNGTTTMVATYAVNPDPNPQPASRAVRLKKPTVSGYEARIADLHNKIVQLEAWKAKALEKYPDLGVAPVVLTARKLVADEVRVGGDNLLANQIMEGLKDSTLMVRVAIRALENAE